MARGAKDFFFLRFVRHLILALDRHSRNAADDCAARCSHAEGGRPNGVLDLLNESDGRRGGCGRTDQVEETHDRPSYENISTLLFARWSDGALRLVDCSHLLPLFRRNPGLTDWKLMNKAGEFVDQANAEAGLFTPSMWPPSQEEREKFQLERCWRIYPHLQDTGGFFCAVLEKVSALPGAPKRAKIDEEAKAAEMAVAVAEATEDKGKEEMDLGNEIVAGDEQQQQQKQQQEQQQQQQPEKKKKRVRRNYESPFIMVDPNSEAGETVRQGIEYFGLDLDPKRFMVRNEKSVG